MKKNKTFTNTIFSILLQLVTIISGFIIPRLLLSTFGSEVNGLVSSINQFLNYITLIEGGLTGVITASLYKPLLNKDKTKIERIVKATYNFYRKIAYIFLIYTIMLALIYPIIVKTNFSYMYIFTLTLILSVNLFLQYFFSLTLKTLLQADKEVKFVSIVQIICIVLSTMLTWGLIKLFPNIHFIKLMTALVYIIQPIAYDRFVRKKYNLDLDAEPDEEALKQRWDGFGINLAAFIHNNTDIVVLSILTNLSNVSIYSVYSLVTTGLKRIVQSVSGGIVPSLGHVYASNDKEALNKMFDSFELIIFIITFILFTCGGILINSFVKVYTLGINDANYNQPVLGWLLIIAEMTFCLREPYVNMAYTANKFKEISKYAYVEAILNIVLSIILVFKFGMVGVAIGTVVSLLYRTICQVYYLKNNILYRKVQPFVKNLVIFTLSEVVIVIISRLFIKMDSVSLLGWMIYAIKNVILTIFAYSIVLFVFYRENIRLLLAKIKK